MRSSMGRVDAQHTGHCKCVGPQSAPPRLRWWAGPDRGFLMEMFVAFMTHHRDPTPVVLDGVVYSIIDKGVLYKIDLATGDRKLTVDFTGGENTGWGAPAVVDDTVYVTVQNSVFALNVFNGDTRWQFTDGWLLPKYFGSHDPVVVENTVYVATDRGHLFAIDATDGTQTWSVATNGMYVSAPAVGDSLVFLASDQRLLAFDSQTGNRLWGMEGEEVFITDPVVTDGLVIVAGLDKILYAIKTRTGEECWHYQANSRLCGAPAAADGSLYVPLEEGNLVALTTSTGRPRWTVHVGKHSSSPTIADGIIYLRVGQKTIRALTAARGESKWQLEVSSDALLYGNVAVTEANILVGGLHNLYALGDGPKRQPGPASEQSSSAAHSTRLRRI